MNVNVDSPEWRAAACLSTQQQPPSPGFDEKQQEQRRESWMRAVSRHAKIIALVKNGASGGLLHCNNRRSDHDVQQQKGDLQRSDLQQQQQQYFHPLHCAASQGMTTAGRFLLQRYSSNDEVKLLRSYSLGL